MANRTILLIICLFVFFSKAHAEVKSVLALNLDNDEYFSETFTLFADLSDGAYIYGQIGVSNIGPGNKRGICRILIVPKNGKPINQSIIVDHQEWSYTDQPTPSLMVKNCLLKQTENNQRLIFSGKIGQHSIHIDLHATPKKQIPPMGRLHTKSGYYFSDILIPWAVSTVEYQYAGEKIKSKGFGYADHSRSTMLPATIAHQWVRFRGINQHNSQLVLARQVTEDDAFSGWAWGQQERHPANVKHLVIQKKVGTPFPKISFITSDNDYQIQIQQLLLRYAPLEEKGFLMRMISYAIGNPVTYTYRARLISNTGEAIPGILEIAEINGN